MEIKIIRLQKPDDVNLILGQAHFIKTVEDIHEIIAGSGTGARFGVAFSEASGPCLVRVSGNDSELIEMTKNNLLSLSSGHSFLIFLRNAYPINILNAVKSVPEVCRIFCATSNPVEVIVAESEQGSGILGVIDGSGPRGVETDKDIRERKQLLRDIGYKL